MLFFILQNKDDKSNEKLWQSAFLSNFKLSTIGINSLTIKIIALKIGKKLVLLHPYSFLLKI